ncbi:MAG: cytochrome c biogenesis protein ResB [Spirochaetia bacterium]|nr:cytochrome c biogenesis protein ResB [Spirochaetia bacterium]
MKLLRLLFSLRLAIVLLILITLLSVAGGVLPQGGSAEMYSRLLPAPVAGAVLLLGLDHAFSSPLFFAAAGLFLINLGACTVRRFTAQQKLRRAKRSVGPDLLHIGILVLAAGGVLTSVGREEQDFLLTSGEEHLIGGEYRIELSDFEYQRYEDGAPKDWISTVSVHRGGELLHERVEIEVNAPLRLGSYTLYQVRHAMRPVARFSDGEFRELRLIVGHPTEIDGATVQFAAVPEGAGSDPEEGIFMIREGMKRTARRLAVGESLLGLKLRSIRTVHISGLQAVRDPGYTVVLVGFILASLGLAVTYVGKIVRIREEN